MFKEMILQPPFLRDGAHGFRVELPDFPMGDRVGNPVCSRIYLFEDGKQFGVPHHGRTSVCTHGHGKYVHWEQRLTFSAPDNSDPNENGRTYKIVWSDDLYFGERAGYFHNALLSLLHYFSVGTEGLKGKNLLEIGCGRNHGLSLIAAGYGANVVACDRYAPLWDEEFHPGYIDFLMRKGASMWSGFDGARLSRFLETKAFDGAPFTFFQEDAEQLLSRIDLAFDYHCSTAALEHFYDMESVAAMLGKTANHGSMGCHWVDFRDHRDFARPLDFLLLDDAAYDTLCGDQKYVHGNRLRPMEYTALFERHGFQDVTPYSLPYDIDPAYMPDFLPRLRASGTRFADEPEETLLQLSVCYVMRKP